MQQDDVVQKNIDDILKLKKPRTFFHFVRMVFGVFKNFVLSLNALVLVAICYLFYRYVMRRNLIRFYVFRMLDKIS